MRSNNSKLRFNIKAHLQLQIHSKELLYEVEALVNVINQN